MRHVTGISFEQQIADPGRIIGDPHPYRDAVSARSSRVPMAHITGMAYFWDVELNITCDVLVPRPETETVLEAAQKLRARGQDIRIILDIGTGSGCLLIALAREYPDALCIGTDCSEAALACAAQNIRMLELEPRCLLVRTDWCEAIAPTVDLIVSNPPYLSDADLRSPMPELCFEPQAALAGGNDGLDAYRALSNGLKRLCHSETLVLLEVGEGQGDAVEVRLISQGFEAIGRYPDLAGIDRVVAFAAS